MDVYVLLDRSGSMQHLMPDAVSAINAYVESLASGPSPEGASITIAAFCGSVDRDCRLCIEVVRETSVIPFDPIGPDEVVPHGTTPLFDAIGEIASMIHPKLPGKALLLIQTDGEENASTRLTAQDAARLISTLRESGVEVGFIGAAFDPSAEAQRLGISGEAVLATADAGGLRVAYAALERETQRLAESDGPGLAFSSVDRAEASRRR